MLRIYLFCFWNELFIPVRIAGLVSAYQQHRGAPRVEGVENTVWTTLVLASELAKIDVLRAVDRVRMWSFEVNSSLFEQSYCERHTLLFIIRKAVPPRFEFVGQFNLVGHIEL